MSTTKPLMYVGHRFLEEKPSRTAARRSTTLPPGPTLPMEQKEFKSNLQWRRFKASVFYGALVCSVATAVLLLCVLLMELALQGGFWLDWQFISSFPSRFPERAGIWSAIWGSVWVISCTGLVAIPLGIGAAVYLEEYAKKTKFGSFVEINISNLAGVPSIIYGLLGLVVFVRAFGLGRSVLSGALTMSLLILPIIIVAAREALKAVPNSIRDAAYALGATKWQAIRAHVLPAALPGILTGIILSLSRAIGETAPLIMVGAVAYVAFVPDGLSSAFTVLPIQIYDWASRPQESFHQLAAAGIIVLLCLLLTMNAAAILIRNHYQRKLKW